MSDDLIQPFRARWPTGRAAASGCWSRVSGGTDSLALLDLAARAAGRARRR